MITEKPNVIGREEVVATTTIVNLSDFSYLPYIKWVCSMKFNSLVIIFVDYDLTCAWSPYKISTFAFAMLICENMGLKIFTAKWNHEIYNDTFTLFGGSGEMKSEEVPYPLFKCHCS